MFKQFFFDDQRLFVRENFERTYGETTLVGTYRDHKICTSYCWAWLIKGPDGKTHLLYQGTVSGSGKMLMAAAISDDGIHFTPRNTAEEAGIKEPMVPNQLFSSDTDGEMAGVIEDKTAPPDERYKILFTDNSQIPLLLYIQDYILASPDLIHWKKLQGSCWNPAGTEPLLGVFFNKVSNKFTILSRPDWGQRRVGVTETNDWHYYTPLEMCLQVDSLDPALAEIYGMPAVAVDDIFIGFPHIYTNYPQVLNTKYFAGTMHAELSYSLNGRHWQRSLRTPFLSGSHPQLVERDGVASKMLFLMSAMKQDNGEILLCATTNTHEHGCPPTQIKADDTSVSIFKMREDGYICLNTKDKQTEGRVATREIIWQAGELSVNLKAQKATCAIYGQAGNDVKPLPGYTHEDCVPFSGDSTHWTPAWKSRATLNAMGGKTVIIEIKLTDGVIYSFSGDGIPVMNQEAARYRRFGNLSQRKGF